MFSNDYQLLREVQSFDFVHAEAEAGQGDHGVTLVLRYLHARAVVAHDARHVRSPAVCAPSGERDLVVARPM